jgi:hypothetical protein
MPPSTATRHRFWKECLSAGFILGLISSAAAQDHQLTPATDRPAPGIEVEVANGLITMHADGAPLAEVLRAIGEAGGFRSYCAVRFSLRSASRSPLSRSRTRSGGWSKAIWW